MYTLKSTIFILFIILITFISCEKDDSLNGITREDYYGTYNGEDTNSTGGWSLASIEISSAPMGNEYVYINYLVRNFDHQITATVNNDHITFNKQKFHVDRFSPGGVHTIYDAVYYGGGVLDTNTHKLVIHYTEEQIFKDTTFVIQWIYKTQKENI